MRGNPAPTCTTVVPAASVAGRCEIMRDHGAAETKCAGCCSTEGRCDVGTLGIAVAAASSSMKPDEAGGVASLALSWSRSALSSSSCALTSGGGYGGGGGTDSSSVVEAMLLLVRRFCAR